MLIRSIKTIREDIPFSIICQVVKVGVDWQRKFIVLRVKDFTKTVVYFRKFNLSNLKKEIYGDGPIEVWKIPSKRVDIVVSFPSEEVIQSLQKGVIVSLRNLECRSVPCSNVNCFVYELYVNTQLGGQLLVLPCNDLKMCMEERLDREAGDDEFPYIGTSTIAKIRRGLSSSLLCEVVQCWRESDTNQVVLRVRDATLTRICIKKFQCDLDYLDDIGQSNEGSGFYKGGSPVVEVMVTSLSRDLGDLLGQIVSLGPVVCDTVLPAVPCSASDAVHILHADAAHPFFHLDTLGTDDRVTLELRKKINSKPCKRKKRKKSKLPKNKKSSSKKSKKSRSKKSKKSRSKKSNVSLARTL